MLYNKIVDAEFQLAKMIFSLVFQQNTVTDTNVLQFKYRLFAYSD